MTRLTQGFRESPRSLFLNLVPEESRKQVRFIHLSNFEAERYWTESASIQLPKISQSTETAIVNRLEEMVLLLSESPDTVILREPSDEQFLSYLRDLGFNLPLILTADPVDKAMPISETVLESPLLCRRLTDIAEENAESYLLPYATTRMEEEISRMTGLGLCGPSAAVAAKVNSKIYSRRIGRALGLHAVPGFECESLGELEAAVLKIGDTFAEAKKVVIKEAMGVSGKGLFVANSLGKLQQVVTRLKQKVRDDARCAFVLETWVDKCKDINYQIFISPTGEVRLLTIKEIVTEGGVHLGHRFPPSITPEQYQQYEEAAQLIGRQLHKDGFNGIAGIDSVIALDGSVYPVLEINARFNMSTYQLGIEKLFAPGATVFAKYYPIMLKEKLAFDRLVEPLKELLFDPESGETGVLIQNFATVNANCGGGEPPPFKGRLYVLLIGEAPDRIQQLDLAMINALKQLQHTN